MNEEKTIWRWYKKRVHDPNVQPFYLSGLYLPRNRKAQKLGMNSSREKAKIKSREQVQEILKELVVQDEINEKLFELIKTDSNEVTGSILEKSVEISKINNRPDDKPRYTSVHKLAVRQKLNELFGTDLEHHKEFVITDGESLQSLLKSNFWIPLMWDNRGESIEKFNTIGYTSNFFTSSSGGQIRRFNLTEAFDHLSSMSFHGLTKKDEKFFKLEFKLYRITRVSNYELESFFTKVMTLYAANFDPPVSVDDLVWVGKIHRIPKVIIIGQIVFLTNVTLLIGRKDIKSQNISPLTRFKKKTIPSNSKSFIRGFNVKEFLEKLRTLYSEQTNFSYIPPKKDIRHSS